MGVSARQRGKAQKAGVFITDGVNDLLRRPSQAGVNHLMACITQYPCNDFCAAVVTVQAGLRNHNAQGVLHGRGWRLILSKVCAGFDDHEDRIQHEPSMQGHG